MRQFSLTNKSGETYILNSLDNFFHDPEGLGFSRNTQYQRVGNNYEILKDNFNQMVIGGSIMFKNEHDNPAYNKYLKFANFLQAIPLVLHYRAARGDEYKIDVIPSEVNKTEITSALGLDVGVSLTTTSLWYRDISETKSGNIVYLVSDSAIESPCHIIFNGLTIDNSSFLWDWRTTEESSPHFGTITGVSIASTDTLHIRTDVNPYTIYKLSSSNVKTDLYNKSSFSTERFPFIRKGRNMIYTNYGNPSSVTVNARIYYETV